MKQPPPAFAAAPASWASSKPPLLRFLDRCHADFSQEDGGAVADYIPELGKADPAHFGISLATLDGHVYEVGDTRIPFTIQSMSKPFVFALALDTLGAARVESAIGVEPSGDPFNSIRLNADNHPFNAMVNAGAITCTSLIREAKGDGAFEYIRQALGRFAGRDLAVDDAVFASESVTGDRNRAIAYLLRTSHVINQDVDAVLETYFRQCAVLVTARDIAVMAATLANRGVNPVTGEQVMTPYAISRTLSVMTSSGMYDYAGEWIYRVGIPAKSGVGGGILAALPARLGLGSYSPKLDSHGNSVRGIKVCEALSQHYDLHMLNRSDDARTSIIADYDIGKNPSRRDRRPHERNILAAHHSDVRVIELVGTLSFSNVDYVSRQLAAKPRPQFVIFDLRRVTSMTRAGARLVAEEFRELAAHGVTVILSGIKRDSQRVENHRRMDRRTLERARLLSARCRDRMGRGPDGLSLRRRDRLSRDHRTVRTGAAGGPDAGGTDRSGVDRGYPNLPRGRKDRHRRASPRHRCSFCAAAPCTSRCPTASGSRRSPRAWPSAKWRCWKPTAPPTCWPTSPPQPTKSACGISSASANSIRGPASGSCATSRNCWPTG